MIFFKSKKLSYLSPYHVCLFDCLFICFCLFVRLEFWKVFFFSKVRIEFLPFALPFFSFLFLFFLFFCLFVFYCLFVLKNNNWVLTFCLAFDFFPKVRIAFLPFSLPLEFFFFFFFWKVRMKFLLFALPCDFFSKVRIEFLPFSLPCLFVCLLNWLFVGFYLFVCLGFWKVRIEFLPFA